MKIQLALDRLDTDEAIAIASAASDFVDWIEAFDNAAYEMKMCFEAGANVATVMGAAPIATIELCKRVADECGAHVVIDLLNVGSAISKARDPGVAARYFREVIAEHANEEMVER
ncbi:hypothetical protein GCM10025859_31250 [Alicyclobacillus fastidiosus]|nr:hypothetical protein GCM10025859_31250 [Alicyclobacillus fastidiosus]